LFSIVERFLGFIYRIFLSRKIGSEGIGIYQISLTIFGLLLTVASSGVPITVSRMMTRRKAEHRPELIHSTVTAGISLCLLISVPIVLIFTAFSSKLSFIFSDSRCMDAFLIILPGLIFTSVYAVLRGSFWGNKSFLPYSLIELLEEAVMLVIGIIAVSQATSMMDGVKRAAWAVFFSYVFSFVTASAVYFIKGGRVSSPKSELKPLIASATPITLMRTSTSLINSLIAVILPLRLVSAGLSNAEAVSQFGTAFGMAFPILFMPGTLIGSLAVVLVPELSESFYKKQTSVLQRNVERALEFSVLIASLVIPVLISFGEALGVFFYDSAEAGKYLEYAAISMLPMSICMISTSMLNSMNMEKQTLIYYLFGAAAMILSILFLPKLIGIYSLIVGLFLQFAITAILNVAALKKKIKADNAWLKFTAKATGFAVPSCLFGLALNGILTQFTPNAFTAIFGSILVALFNATLYFVFGLIKLKRPQKADAVNSYSATKSL